MNKLQLFLTIILLLAIACNPSERGLEGRVTYSAENTTEPDVGASIFLLKKENTTGSISNSISFYKAKANEQGKFEIDAIPEGDYLLIIQSANKKAKSPTANREVLMKYDIFSLSKEIEKADEKINEANKELAEANQELEKVLNMLNAAPETEKENIKEEFKAANEKLEEAQMQLKEVAKFLSTELKNLMESENKVAVMEISIPAGQNEFAEYKF